MAAFDIMALTSLILTIFLLPCCLSTGFIARTPGKFPPLPPSPYPITAAIFREGRTSSEWNDTLRMFSRMGGDTVILDAPALELTTKKELESDPHLHDCVPSDMTSSCVAEAAAEVRGKLGLNVTWATFFDGDPLNNKTLRCREVEKLLKFKDTRKSGIMMVILMDKNQ